MKTDFASYACCVLTFAIFSSPLVADEARKITPEQAARLVPFDSPVAAEYITGDYSVTISSDELRKAVLKPLSSALRFRVVITYPEGFDIPKQAEQVTLAVKTDGVRYKITAVTKDEHGILTVAAEVEKSRQDAE